MEQQLELAGAKTHNNLVAETLVNHKAARNTQHDKLLALLRSRKGEWIPLPEILKLGIAQYNTRILELRRQGFRIENKLVSMEDGIRHTAFRLVE